MPKFFCPQIDCWSPTRSWKYYAWFCTTRFVATPAIGRDLRHGCYSGNHCDRSTWKCPSSSGSQSGPSKEFGTTFAEYYRTETHCYYFIFIPMIIEYYLRCFNSSTFVVIDLFKYNDTVWRWRRRCKNNNNVFVMLLFHFACTNFLRLVLPLSIVTEKRGVTQSTVYNKRWWRDKCAIRRLVLIEMKACHNNLVRMKIIK